eukprot:GFYU01000283.1.p1 GENE.GFYU01000283.1~~GFYU01000283.1.p1  ORF type:complete len:549 (+),score=197.61 GFYU01000283.1:90-1736(+)
MFSRLRPSSLTQATKVFQRQMSVRTIDLSNTGVNVKQIYRNPSVGFLYERGVLEEGTNILENGALCAMSYEKTGRSPKDKRVVENAETKDSVWWGNVNVKLPQKSFEINRERALAYLNTKDNLYVVDAFAGADPDYRLKVRIVCTRAYHALFMWNMLIRPTEEELATFGEPDYTIYNAGQFPANQLTEGVGSKTCVSLDFMAKEMVILGTQYAGEMKKGVFTIMHYLMPNQGVVSLHASANSGPDGDVSLFFGLSGTGKTTLSADPHRALIGDDEHVWTDKGVFNIEGGCYAKAIDLTEEKEPEIFRAIRYGSILENVVYDEQSREVDYTNTSLTENTRCSYPLKYIPNAAIPSVGGHPKNVIFLTCDAYGVLPPVSKLTADQAMYHFISGYTAKVAGTEMGVTEPQATFSACFGEAFLVHHPSKYAEMLAEKLNNHGANAWLINTGWTGGGHGVGNRMSLPHTRAIIDAIHSGELESAPTETLDIFGLNMVTKCSNVPDTVLNPGKAWADKDAFKAASTKLASMFVENFKTYEAGSSPAIKAAGPQL